MIRRPLFAPHRATLLFLLLLMLALLSGCAAIRNRNWPWKPWQPKTNTAVVMDETMPFMPEGTLPPPISIGDEGKGSPVRSATSNALSISEVRPTAGAEPVAGLEPIYFDYNSRELNPEMKARVAAVAQWIARNAAGRKVLVEGHCDERGTSEYNTSLGQDRANSVREELYRAGISPELVSTVSYGKDRPMEFGHDEAAWAKNRRVQFLLY